MWSEGVEEAADAAPGCVDGSLSGFAQECLQLGEHLLDRVQIGAVGWQEEEFGAGRADGASDCRALVTAEIIHDDDVAAVQGRHQEVLDVGQERAAIDRAIEHAGCVDAVGAQRREKSERSPAAVRHLRPQSLAARCAAVGARQIGFRRGLVDEDQPSRIRPALILLPLRATPGDRRPVLLAGVHGFF